MLHPTVLFGEVTALNSRRKYNRDRNRSHGIYHEEIAQDSNVAAVRVSTDDESERRPTKGSLADFFFGFMYEEEATDDDEHLLYSSVVESTASIFNPVNRFLFMSLALSAFATAVPVALVASLSLEFSGTITGNMSTADESSFAPRAASAAVLGTSIGKFINGPASDVWGARRTSSIYSLLLAFSLVFLACAPNAQFATWACFLCEFCSSVQWPCCVVILATHYRGNTNGMYEGGIYLTSLAMRLGSLIGIPTCSLLLRQLPWRIVALVGAWAALLSLSVTYLYVEDAPGKPDDPQNPIDPNLLRKWFPDSTRQNKRLSAGVILRLAAFVFHTNLLPSIKHIAGSGTFWIVALAHTGSAMVRTSERVLGTYLFETSNSSLSESRASGLAVFLSVGTVAGLIIAGSIFASRQERERKWLVSRLYMFTIISCYSLSFFAIPAVRRLLNAPELVTVFQTMAIASAGFGIAVPFYHIPSLVGATFGCDKGLYSSYTDGVAYGFASFVWRIVGDAVQHSNSLGGGWAYGWAAVALLLIPSAILMVEFMEHYFCRHRYGGTLETILIA